MHKRKRKKRRNVLVGSALRIGRAFRLAAPSKLHLGSIFGQTVAREGTGRTKRRRKSNA